ncbi:MAG: LysM peptidoglycan-binding domain-containing protein [Aureispira sp.]|nr:LysM peptidoglycan-binding domain-containing protein [Aureispira sp.]
MEKDVKLLQEKIKEWATLYKTLKKDGKQLDSANNFKKVVAAVLPSVNTIAQKGVVREQGGAKVQPVNSSEEYGKKYQHRERIELDFYPLTVKLMKLDTTLKTKFAQPKNFFYLTSSDVLSSGHKDFIDIEIQGKNSFQNSRIYLEQLPCSLTIELKWPEDLEEPSQDSGENSYAMGEYNSKKSVYTISHGDGMGGGDTLAGIAKRFDTSVPAIMDLNDMASKSLEGIKTLKMPDTSFVASSPDNYEIHSPFYTNMLMDMLSEGQSIEEVISELSRLQNKGYKDDDSEDWGKRNYDSKEGEAITEDYRNPEGTVSIQGYTNAKDGEPVRFNIYQGVTMDNVPGETGNTIYIDYVVPKAKEDGILDRIWKIGGGEWTHSGPYWLWTGELGEDIMDVEEVFPMAKKVGFTIVAIFSCGAAVWAGGTWAIVVTGTNLAFTIDDDLGDGTDSFVQKHLLPEELHDAYDAFKILAAIEGGKLTVLDMSKAKSITSLQALGLTKSIFGSFGKTQKIIND